MWRKMMTEFQDQRWADIKCAFSDWSIEDAYNLRKAQVLQNVSTYWQNGIIQIANLDLLRREFSYDSIIDRIYDHMLERVNDRIILRRNQGEDLDMSDYEYMFSHQPYVYAVAEDNTKKTVLYDVDKCLYKRRLVTKYPKLFNVIQDMVMI